MEDPNSTLLPYILETLSRKAELSDTFDNLCKEIEEQLMAENNCKYGNVRNALQRALNVGQSLGIITLTNETIRVPFNFRANSKNAKIVPTAANQQMPQPAIGTGNPQPQNANSISVKNRKVNSNRNNYQSKDEDPDYRMIRNNRSRPVRMPQRIPHRGRSYGRKPSRARNYSRARSRGRGRSYSRRR